MAIFFYLSDRVNSTSHLPDIFEHHGIMQGWIVYYYDDVPCELKKKAPC